VIGLFINRFEFGLVISVLFHRSRTLPISAASDWEIAIKVSLGKYQLPTASFETWILRQRLPFVRNASKLSGAVNFL
jgi:PIN domain nuclease of toxin-antitoxin system